VDAAVAGAVGQGAAQGGGLLLGVGALPTAPVLVVGALR